MKFLTVATMQSNTLWEVTPCILLEDHRHIGDCIASIFTTKEYAHNAKGKNNHKVCILACLLVCFFGLPLDLVMEAVRSSKAFVTYLLENAEPKTRKDHSEDSAVSRFSASEYVSLY
jgi:hypothetical protein